MPSHIKYSLSFKGATLSALKLKRDGKSDMARVEWFANDEFDDRQIGELARGGKNSTLILPIGTAGLLQTQLPPLPSKEISAALQGLIQKQKGPGKAGWVSSHILRDVQDDAAPGPDLQTYTVLYAERASMMNLNASCAKRGLQPRTVLPAPLALECLLRAELKGSREEKKKSWSLIYMGREEFFLVIGDMHGPLLYRNLPVDLSSGADRDEYLKRFITEIERSNFFAKQSEQSFTVESIYVSGDPGLVIPLAEQLDGNIDLPVTHWQPQNRFEFEEDIEGWAVLPLLAAAALDSRVMPLNLFIKPDREGARRAFRTYGFAATCTLLLIAAPLLLGASLHTRGVQESIIRIQSDQLLRARDQASECAKRYLLEQSLISREERIALNGDKQTPLAEILRDVAARLPDKVRLVDLRLRQEPGGRYRLYITGESFGESSEKAQSSYILFRDSLSRSPLISGEEEPNFIQIQASESKTGFKSKISFSIEYQLEKGDRV